MKKKFSLGATTLWSPLKFNSARNIIEEDGVWNLDS